MHSCLAPRIAGLLREREVPVRKLLRWEEGGRLLQPQPGEGAHEKGGFFWFPLLFHLLRTKGIEVSWEEKAEVIGLLAIAQLLPE